MVDPLRIILFHKKPKGYSHPMVADIVCHLKLEKPVVVVTGVGDVVFRKNGEPIKEILDSICSLFCLNEKHLELYKKDKANTNIKDKQNHE
ncbi:MAG: hypothetical protein COA90_07920 [Gammaproteobacteria bacterium]|nr:MAG: hypothetical protein COA90_07920 [Gammaproteobacteria bacterium]